MSKLIITLLLSFFFFPVAGAVEDIDPAKVKIISVSEFEEQYGNTVQWQHIARLKKDNPNFDFTNVNIPSDFSSLTVSTNIISAYKLYDGRMVVFNGGVCTGSSLKN